MANKPMSYSSDAVYGTACR